MDNSSALTEILSHFQADLKAQGLLPKEIVADGQIHRCPVEGKPHGSDGAYILHPDAPASGWWLNWRTGESGNWSTKEEGSLSPAEKRALQARIEACRHARQEEEAKRHAEAATVAQGILSSLPACSEHPYLDSKGVMPCAGLKARDPYLIVPVLGEDGHLMSFQSIAPDGEKRFFPGGRTKGGYFIIGGISERIHVCEGLATGLSIHEATGQIVFVAFNCGNLREVATIARRKYPTQEIVLCADNDHNRDKNPGLIDATSGAIAVGGFLAVPEFKEPEGKTDFNDLHQSEGLDAVRAQLALAAPPRKDEQDTLPDDELVPSPRLRAAHQLIRNIGEENILHAQSSFWIWRTNGIWECIDAIEIKQAIQRQERHHKNTNSSFVNDVCALVQNEVFKPGHEFDVDRQGINCDNGLLRLVEGKWELHPHNREDYRTAQIPVAYDPNATAPRFMQFLREVFRDDPDCEAKCLIVLEAMGYSLMSSCQFERFFLLVGNGANGKSVLLGILADLVGKKQVSAVRPDSFGDRFQRAHLRGKLVNIVTEIPEGHQIADAELKALTSGELTTAEHKHQPPFDFIPYATHWFATNHMPHTRDFSDALFRRVIVIQFNRIFDSHERDVKLAAKLRKELPGILNLVLEALAGVIERNDFTHASSCESAKEEWRKEADQVAQFVAECCTKGNGHGEKSGAMYAKYKAWAEENGIQRKINHANFTKRIKRLGAEPGRGSGGTAMIFGFRLNRSSDPWSDASDSSDALLYNRQAQHTNTIDDVVVVKERGIHGDVGDGVTCVTRVTAHDDVTIPVRWNSGQHIMPPILSLADPSVEHLTGEKLAWGPITSRMVV